MRYYRDLICAAGLLIIAVLSIGCQAKTPSSAEVDIAQKAKEVVIGGKDWTNPTPDNAESQQRGGEHFRHHCQFCHGLDGQNTGVPFADTMSPPVADLASKAGQAYQDGQLKWIIENGIRFSGMPAWKGILTDDEMWYMVRYIRHLPPKGSLGPPKEFEENEHERAEARATGQHLGAH
jgi:mono/diheme cytochrome c family protein